MDLHGDEDAALQQAIAAELRAAQAAASMSGPDLAEQAGIKVDTVYRVLRGRRPVGVVEMIRLCQTLNTDDVELLERAKRRASALPSQSARSNQSLRLGEKMALIASSRGKSLDALYFDVVGPMSKQGFSMPRKAWNELISGSNYVARSEVLFSLAEALSVDPRYFFADDSKVDGEVEARLRFQRAMTDLGVNEVAARSIGTVAADDLEALGSSITRAIEDLRGR